MRRSPAEGVSFGRSTGRPPIDDDQIGGRLPDLGLDLRLLDAANHLQRAFGRQLSCRPAPRAALRIFTAEHEQNLRKKNIQKIVRPTKLTPTDRPRRDLQLCFWFQDDRTGTLATKRKNKASAMRAICWSFCLFREFVAERVIGSNRTQQTLDRRFQELSNDVFIYEIRS